MFQFVFILFLEKLIFLEKEIMSNKDLNHKMQLLSDAAVQLKKEFVGIDYQIDQVLDNLRTWFLFPELQERPLVISLFGFSKAYLRIIEYTGGLCIFQFRTDRRNVIVGD